MTEFAPYYYFVYWFIVMLMTVNTFNAMRRYPAYVVIQKHDEYQPLFIFSVFYILFWGFRPIDGVYFGDTAYYAQTYRMLENFGVFNSEGYEDAGSDWAFYLLMRFCSHVIDVQFFFTLTLFSYIVLMFVGCRKLDKRHGATLMLFCIGAFSFYTYSVNGIRNGMACSMVVMALALLNKGNKIWSIILSFIAIGCHKSAALPVVCMFFVYYVRKPKLMYFAWFGAIAISLVFGSQIDAILSALSFDERLAGNLQNNEADGLVLEHRFRWDFLFYSFMPILLGWYTIFKRKLQDKTYLLLLGTYIYANSFWILAIRGLFSNRIAYLSWFIYPIVLAYPLLNLPVFKHNHSKKAALILLGHFGFTTILWLMGKVG